VSSQIQKKYARKYLSRPSLTLKELAQLSTATEDGQVPKHSSIKTFLVADKAPKKWLDNFLHLGLGKI